MKKMIHMLALTLALNFLALAGFVGWLYKSGHLDKQRIAAIKEIVWAGPATAPATQPAVESSGTTRPALSLEELLARHAGLPVSDQVDYLRRTFDIHMAELDRRGRELTDLLARVDLEKNQVTDARAALDKERKAFETQVADANKTAGDKGFQDTMERYNAMAPKQVKTIFMGLDDPTVVKYLQAMETRAAAKIMKEFKSPDETDRLKRLMEKMRQTNAAVSKE